MCADEKREFELLMNADERGKTDGDGPNDVDRDMIRSMEHDEGDEHNG